MWIVCFFDHSDFATLTFKLTDISGCKSQLIQKLVLINFSDQTYLQKVDINPLAKDKCINDHV